MLFGHLLVTVFNFVKKLTPSCPCIEWSPKRDCFQPPKLWKAIGTGIGTLIGKNKMIPHISPGKTWEGFIFGCLTFAVGGGCLMFYLFKDEMPLLEWRAVVILSFCLAVIAALGDLAESILKRSLAVKDSGNILPGIGGVLDLLDSVLFTAPVLFIYLTLLS